MTLTSAHSIGQLLAGGFEIPVVDGDESPFERTVIANAECFDPDGQGYWSFWAFQDVARLCKPHLGLHRPAHDQLVISSPHWGRENLQETLQEQCLRWTGMHPHAVLRPVGISLEINSDGEPFSHYYGGPHGLELNVSLFDRWHYTIQGSPDAGWSYLLSLKAPEFLLSPFCPLASLTPRQFEATPATMMPGLTARDLDGREEFVRQMREFVLVKGYPGGLLSRSFLVPRLHR